jgi:hypothetical protein
LDADDAIVELVETTGELEVVIVEEVELNEVVDVVVDLVDNAKNPAPAMIIIITTTTTIRAILLIARLKFLKVKLQTW